MANKGYIEKEKDMLQKMHDTDWEVFDGDKDDALEFMSRQLMTFPDYVNCVIKEQVLMPIYSYKYEGQDYRDAVQSLDRGRRISHDAAISSVNILNRFSERLGLGKFADVDTSNRYAVADFCGAFTLETFDKGIGKTMDEAALGRTEPYDTKQVPSSLSKLLRQIEHDDQNAKEEENEGAEL